MAEVAKLRTVVRDSSDSKLGCVAILGCTYLQILTLEKLLERNRPSSPRKRVKAGLPPDEVLVIELRLLSNDSLMQPIKFSLGFTSPLDAPASVVLPTLKCKEISPGTELEFRVVTQGRFSIGQGK